MALNDFAEKQWDIVRVRDKFKHYLLNFYDTLAKIEHPVLLVYYGK